MHSMMLYSIHTSPIGRLLLIGNNQALYRLIIETTEIPLSSYTNHLPANHLPAKNQLDNVRRQLDDYFIQRRKQFTIPTFLVGTNFQKKVWKALQSTLYGQTYSYKSIAEKIQHPKAFRALGSANRVNPIPIIIPCHRIISANGQLADYVAGIHLKAQLLELEGNTIVFDRIQERIKKID